MASTPGRQVRRFITNLKDSDDQQQIASATWQIYTKYFYLMVNKSTIKNSLQYGIIRRSPTLSMGRTSLKIISHFSEMASAYKRERNRYNLC